MLTKSVKSASLIGISSSVTKAPEVLALTGSPIWYHKHQSITMVGRHCEQNNKHKIFESGQDQMVL